MVSLRVYAAPKTCDRVVADRWWPFDDGIANRWFAVSCDKAADPTMDALRRGQIERGTLACWAQN
jgi:hypothetical protein